MLGRTSRERGRRLAATFRWNCTASLSASVGKRTVALCAGKQSRPSSTKGTPCSAGSGPPTKNVFFAARWLPTQAVCAGHCEAGDPAGTRLAWQPIGAALTPVGSVDPPVLAARGFALPCRLSRDRFQSPGTRCAHSPRAGLGASRQSTTADPMSTQRPRPSDEQTRPLRAVLVAAAAKAPGHAAVVDALLLREPTTLFSRSEVQSAQTIDLIRARVVALAAALESMPAPCAVLLSGLGSALLIGGPLARQAVCRLVRDLGTCALSGLTRCRHEAARTARSAVTASEDPAASGAVAAPQESSGPWLAAALWVWICGSPGTSVKSRRRSTLPPGVRRAWNRLPAEERTRLFETLATVEHGQGLRAIVAAHARCSGPDRHEAVAALLWTAAISPSRSVAACIVEPLTEVAAAVQEAHSKHETSLQARDGCGSDGRSSSGAGRVDRQAPPAGAARCARLAEMAVVVASFASDLLRISGCLAVGTGGDVATEASSLQGRGKVADGGSPQPHAAQHIEPHAPQTVGKRVLGALVRSAGAIAAPLTIVLASYADPDTSWRHLLVQLVPRRAHHRAVALLGSIARRVATKAPAVACAVVVVARPGLAALASDTAGPTLVMGDAAVQSLADLVKHIAEQAAGRDCSSGSGPVAGTWGTTRPAPLVLAAASALLGCAESCRAALAPAARNRTVPGCPASAASVQSPFASSASHLGPASAARSGGQCSRKEGASTGPEASFAAGPRGHPDHGPDMERIRLRYRHCATALRTAVAMLAPGPASALTASWATAVARSALPLVLEDVPTLQRAVTAPMLPPAVARRLARVAADGVTRSSGACAAAARCLVTLLMREPAVEAARAMRGLPRAAAAGSVASAAGTAGADDDRKSTSGSDDSTRQATLQPAMAFAAAKAALQRARAHRSRRPPLQKAGALRGAAAAEAAGARGPLPSAGRQSPVKLSAAPSSGRPASPPAGHGGAAMSVPAPTPRSRPSRTPRGHPAPQLSDGAVAAVATLVRRGFGATLVSGSVAWRVDCLPLEPTSPCQGTRAGLKANSARADSLGLPGSQAPLDFEAATVHPSLLATIFGPAADGSHGAGPLLSKTKLGGVLGGVSDAVESAQQAFAAMSKQTRRRRHAQRRRHARGASPADDGPERDHAGPASASADGETASAQPPDPPEQRRNSAPAEDTAQRVMEATAPPLGPVELGIAQGFASASGAPAEAKGRVANACADAVAALAQTCGPGMRALLRREALGCVDALARHPMWFPVEAAGAIGRAMGMLPSLTQQVLRSAGANAGLVNAAVTNARIDAAGLEATTDAGALCLPRQLTRPLPAAKPLPPAATPLQAKSSVRSRPPCATEREAQLGGFAANGRPASPPAPPLSPSSPDSPGDRQPHQTVGSSAESVPSSGAGAECIRPVRRKPTRAAEFAGAPAQLEGEPLKRRRRAAPAQARRPAIWVDEDGQARPRATGHRRAPSDRSASTAGAAGTATSDPVLGSAMAVASPIPCSPVRHLQPHAPPTPLLVGMTPMGARPGRRHFLRGRPAVALAAPDFSAD